MIRYLQFVETRVFSKQVNELLSAEQYRDFQMELARNPLSGDLVVGTGGLRKTRFGLEGKGKSGGIRVLYLYLQINELIYLVYAFAKGERDNISDAQKKELKKLVDAIKQAHRRG